MAPEKWYVRYKAEGRCIDCAKPNPDTRITRCPECAAIMNARAKEFRLAKISRGECLCGRKARPGKRACDRCAKLRSASSIARHNRIKQRVFDHYGNQCACCGESEPAFLAIDHIRNDGRLERKKDGTRSSGGHMYRRIIRANFPDTFQILCHNCNVGKHINGGVCPHKSALAFMRREA